jgi:hypothetical protein
MISASLRSASRSAAALKGQTIRCNVGVILDRFGTGIPEFLPHQKHDLDRIVAVRMEHRHLARRPGDRKTVMGGLGRAAVGGGAHGRNDLLLILVG